MSKYGFYYGYWQHDYDADFQYYVKKYAKLGFDVLEVDPGILSEMPLNKRKELKKCADYYGIYLTYAFGFPAQKDMASKDENIQKAAVELAYEIIDTVASIGGTELPGIIHSAWNPIIEDDMVYDKKPYVNRSLENMKKVSKALEDNNITYYLEPVNRFEHYMINTLKEAVDYIDSLDSPNVKILADVFHLNIEEQDMLDAIKKTGQYIGYVHLGENNRNLPGSASMNWDGIANSFKEIKYDGCIILEPFVSTGGAIAKDVRVWRNLLNDTSESSLDKHAVESINFVKKKFNW